ncbi:MAG: MFS transporter [Bacteroidota bacterium]|jgi:MFS family permease|nr:MFS transporter [Bacteroidota bacterium]
MAHQSNARALFLLFTANAVSGFSQGLTMLAIPWYFAKQNQSSTFTIAYGFITLLVLFFGLYAGTLVDKYSRKGNFLAINLICGSLILAIASAGFYNQALPPFFVIAVFGITLLNYNIHYPTLYAFAHEITEPNQYQKVNSWIEVVGQSTSILSGALAALLIDGVDTSAGKLAGFAMNVNWHIPKWEIWEIFLLDAITYFLATLLIAGIRYKPVHKFNPELGSVVKRVKTGFSYLKANKPLLVFGLFSYAVFAALLVCIHSLLPIYVEKHLHEDGSVFATADLIYAIGALGAGMFVGKVFGSNQTIQAIVFLTGLAAALFFWAFASQEVWVIYVFCLLLGFSNAGIRVLRLTYFFQHIPNEIMGRVNSIFNMSNVLMRTLFIFLFSLPFFTSSSDIVWAFFILSVFLAISAGVLYQQFMHKK